VRPLGGYEQLFWACDTVSPFNFCVAVCFRGVLAHSHWTAAFAHMQAKHPFLNVAVNHDDPHAPVFTRGKGLPIPVRFQGRISYTQWLRVMEQEIAEPFDQATAPLLRAVLLEDAEGCDLVLTTNHIIGDGIGVVGFVRDLVAALAGHTFHTLPLPPTAEERVAGVNPSTPLLVPLEAPSAAPAPPATGDAAAGPVAEPAARAFAYRALGGKPAIAALRLSVEQTDLLLRSSRHHRTTAGAVLLAAIDSALRRLSPALKDVELHLATPVDARPYLHNHSDFVLSISSARASSPPTEAGLWATARAIRTQLAPSQSLEEIETAYNRVRAVLAAKMDTAVLVQSLVKKFGHDAMLSNLKHVDFPAMPPGLAVEAVWGPSVYLGVEGEQVIGAATFDGALHLLYTSFTPLPGLLEMVSQIIADACAESTQHEAS
jgi:hypothetical protein